MTDLVSLLLIALILIDCKITNFSLYLFVYFFGEDNNIGEFFRRKNDHEYYFFRVPHPLINKKFICH